MVSKRRKTAIAVTLDEDVRYLSLGAGLFVPIEFTAEIDDPSLPNAVILHVVLLMNHYALERIEVVRRSHDAYITGEAIRALPIAELIHRAASHQLFSLVETASDDVDPLEYLAARYRFAELLGEAPTEAVAEHLGVSRATAGRRIAAARAAGLLAPARSRATAERRIAAARAAGQLAPGRSGA